MPTGNAQQTTIDAYQLVKTFTAAAAFASPFPLGINSGDMDLLEAKHGGKGEETKANYVEMIITTNGAGSGIVEVTGACDKGPEEYIASLAIDSADDIEESGTWNWATTIALTSAHLSGCSIAVADSGNGRVCKFGFDAIGLRYINLYAADLTTITGIRVYARYF